MTDESDGFNKILGILWGRVSPEEIAEFSRQQDERREQETRQRAERARGDALVRFLWHDVPGAWICPLCSALVSQRDAHLDWHAEMSTAAQAAHDTSWRSRSIGSDVDQER